MDRAAETRIAFRSPFVVQLVKTSKDTAMTTYYVYAENDGDLRLLGEVAASDDAAASSLAAYLWPQTPLRIETRMLRFDTRLMVA